MTIYKAPDFTLFNTYQKELCVFLAGSIEMGKAVNWQAETGKLLSSAGFNVLNPRRDDWDSSWEQSIENEQFEQQVRWELMGLERAEVVIVHFDPDTKSPITLLELGLLSQRKPSRTFVSCAPGFWRRGNVEIICDRYKVELFESLTDATGAVIAKLNEIEEARRSHREPLPAPPDPSVAIRGE